MYAVVACGDCGAKNKISERFSEGSYQCGKCGTLMDSPFRYVVFDCETTGLPSQRSEPFLVQLAWSAHDRMGNTIEEHVYVIRPEGFEIPVSSTSVHGIFQTFAAAWGKSLREVLLEFSNTLAGGNVRLIAHNFEFDSRVMRAELTRLGLNASALDVPMCCTMREAKDLCRLPSRGPDWKFPSLQELHRYVFNKGFSGGHNALNDVRATAACFFSLCRSGKLVPS